MPPEEMQSSVQGPNGERLQVTVGSKSIGLSVKDLLPILLLFSGLVGGYLIWLQIDKRFELFQTHHLQVFKMLLEQKEFTRQETEKLYKALLTVQYNMARPREEQLPLGLELPTPETPPQAPR